MADLITSARAKYNLNNRTTTANEDTTLAALVTACSKAIEKYCRREFTSTQHDELYGGNGQRRLLLRQFPVISVQRVAYDPTTVLMVTNTSASNQRATVSVTSTGLSLTRVASGVSSTSTVAFAGNATLTAVKDAVNALGNGWSATIPDSDYASWASGDLRALQGSLSAKDVEAPLKIHVRELSSFEVNAERGWLLRGAVEVFSPLDLGPAWFGGTNYWRVIYTAGHATVPEDVQEACAQWVAALFWQTKRDPGLVQEQIAGAGLRTPAPGMPETVRELLAPYRCRYLVALEG
jgi:hypothetical protein